MTRSLRNLQERDGKNAGSHRKSPDHESSFPAGKFRIFSGDFRPVSGGKAQESDRNAPGKIQKFSGRNTAPMIRWLPVYSYRNCPVLFDLGSKIPGQRRPAGNDRFRWTPGGFLGSSVPCSVPATGSHWFPAASCVRYGSVDTIAVSIAYPD